MAYDGQGNLASKNGTGYTFDYGNRLRSTAGLSYRYDADGRRVRQDNAGTSLKYSDYAKDGRLLWQRDEPASKRINNVYLAGSLLAEITRPIGSNAPTISYFHTDALGSPIAKTNAAGAIIETSEYEPYGRLLNRNNDDRAGYTGHVMDAVSGLTYMQQRYYDPGIGRFLSVDPVTANSATGSNFNRYWYGNNSPYKFSDPDGRKIFDPYLLASGYGDAAELGSTREPGPGSGQPASESIQKQNNEYSYPLRDSDPAWTRDPDLRKKTEKAWAESNPNAPSVDRGQPGSQKHEQGGWVVKSSLGRLDLIRFAAGSRREIAFGRRPSCTCVILGWLHTHPNTVAEGFSQHAGYDDFDNSQKRRLPGLVRSHIGYEIIYVYP